LNEAIASVTSNNVRDSSSRCAAYSANAVDEPCSAAAAISRGAGVLGYQIARPQREIIHDQVPR
jgi:hypothetical protein